MRKSAHFIKSLKYALPSFITLLSLACGFTSILISLNSAKDGFQTQFQVAAGLLVLAGVFDALDGYVARATGTASNFGAHLDSIIDVVNFGMAPAVLLYCYGFFPLSGDHPRIHWLGIAACFFFTTCGALRLARFNSQIEYTDPRYFVGMPITAGAACVASVVVGWPSSAATPDLAYLLLALLAIIGLLMVSNLRFPSSKYGKPHGRAAAILFPLIGILVFFLLVVLRERVFAALFSTYAVLALLLNLAWWSGWRGVELPLRYSSSKPHIRSDRHERESP